jgi:AraC-like DNA-binding protein
LQLEYGATVEINPGQLDEFLLVQMPQAGQSKVYHPRGEALVTRDIAGVIAPTVPFRIRWERDCRQLLLKIPRRKLEQACTTYIGSGLRKPIEFQFDMDLRTPAGANWRQLVDYLLNNLALNDTRAVSPLALAHIEEMVVAHLLMHQPHNYSESLEQASDTRNVAPKCVKRAEEYMESHLSEPISLSDIAEFAGVKVRTLCQSFKSFRNTSPMSALRDMRLEGARADMVAGTRNSVTDIAYHWGFNHLGRFSILYKERFGERPHETLRR